MRRESDVLFDISPPLWHPVSRDDGRLASVRAPVMTLRSGPSSLDASTDEALVAAVRSGTPGADEVLLGRYMRMMNGLAFRLVGPRLREEVVQESVCQALRSLRHLVHAEGLGTWFSRIVVAVARKELRRRRLLARLGFVDAAPVEWETAISPTAPADVVIELKAVYGAIERLPSRARAAFILRRIEGRSLDEIAEILEASLASVKRWIAAGEKALAEGRGGPR